MLFGVLLATPAVPQSLVRDLAAGSSTGGSFSSSWVELNGRCYFLARSGADSWLDVGVWSTDGTAAGTVLVRYLPATGTQEMVAFAGALYFCADVPGLGMELWRSDGTGAGTALFADLNPGRDGSWPTELTVAGNHLYFRASTPANGTELWCIDATASNPRLVVDAQPGPGSSAPTLLTAAGPDLAFAADDGVHGRELWWTDGTAAGSRLVVDIHPSGDGIDSEAAAALGGVLYFPANDGPTHGRELWRSDGTAAGTRMVHDVASGPRDGIYLSSMISLDMCVAPAAGGSAVYFPADDGVNGMELWRTDGVVTSLVADVFAGYRGSGPRALVAHAGGLLFIADDGVHGDELWRSDATGTRLLADVNPGPGDGLINSRPLSIGPRALFAAEDGAHGWELWQTDGTVPGTTRVTVPGGGPDMWRSVFIDPWGGVLGGGLVVFQGGDTSHAIEPWRSDGTANGTYLLADLTRHNADSFPAWVQPVGRTMYIAADHAMSNRLWRSDGTAAGTVVVDPAQPFSVESEEDQRAELGDVLLFGAGSPLGKELWRSDGSAAGTFLLRDIAGGSASALPYGADVVTIGPVAVFAADDGVHGIELWRTDGTSAGTSLLKDILAGPGAAIPFGTGMVRVDDIVLFVADDGVTGAQLWRTDGTVAGTLRVTAIQPPLSFADLRMGAVVGRDLLFFADDGATGFEPWRSDGTAAGTSLVFDVAPGPAGSIDPYQGWRMSQAVSIGGRAVFRADDGVSGFEPWSTDLTAGGTIRLADIYPGREGLRNWEQPGDIVGAGDTAFLFADDGVHGLELWATDGTIAGTRLVLDIHPGAISGIRDNDGHPIMAPLGSSSGVVFTADDGVHGAEAWVSDGTPRGTFMLGDVAPGGAGSWPIKFDAARGNLFWIADDGVTGYEPWTMPLRRVGAHLVAKLAGGCPGTGGLVPRIGRLATPTLGDPGFAITVARGRPSAPASLLVGNDAIPRVRLWSCDLLVAPWVDVRVGLDASGAGRVGLAVPNTASLVGAECTFQWAVLDPSGAYANLLSFSDGLAVIVGVK